MTDLKITEQIINQAGGSLINLLKDNQHKIDMLFQVNDKISLPINVTFQRHKSGIMVITKVNAISDRIKQELAIVLDPNRDSLSSVEPSFKRVK